jgi:peroxiredoxin
MKKLSHILFLSCLKASELIEKKMHFKLSFTEKLQLKVHKSMCSACRLYEEHSEIIENGISRHFNGEEKPTDIEKLKKRISKVLESQEN